MSRKKQIKNMARAIHLNCHKGLTLTEAEMIAKWCYREIDRVSLKNAREIFEEIDKQIAFFRMYMFLNNGVKAIVNTLDELKKKYTEEGK